MTREEFNNIEQYWIEAFSGDSQKPDLIILGCLIMQRIEENKQSVLLTLKEGIREDWDGTFKP
jgi:hypothetical protein